MQYKDLIKEIIGAMNGNDIEAMYKNMYEEYTIVVLHITNAFWYPTFIYTSNTEEVDEVYNEHAEVCVLYTENFFDEFMEYSNEEQKLIYNHLTEEATV